MTCSTCGAQLASGFQFCTQCGAEVGSQLNGISPAPSTPVSSDDRPLAEIGPKLVFLLLIIYGAWQLWHRLVAQGIDPLSFINN